MKAEAMIRPSVHSIALSATLLLSLSGFGWAQPEAAPESKSAVSTPAPDAEVTPAPAPPSATNQTLEFINESKLPEATQVYVKSPSSLEGIYSSVWFERILDTPLGDYLMQEVVNELGELPILLRQDVLPYVQGNITLALVREGSDSALERLNKASSQEEAYLELHRQVGFLGKEVAKFKAKFNRLPKNWDEMVKEKVRKSPPVSDYATFVIRDEGQDWTVNALYRDKLSLESYAPAPSFSGKRGIGRPPSPTRALHALVGFDASSVDKLREALNSTRAQQMGVAHVDPTHWKVKIDGFAPWLVTIKNNQVVASDDEQLLSGYTETTTATSSKRLGRLSDNRRFLHQIQQLGQAGPRDIFAFVDLKDLLNSTPSLGLKEARLDQFESIGLVSRRAFNKDGSIPYQVSTQAILQVSPNQGSLIPAKLAEPATWDFVANMPSQTSILYAWQTGEAVRLFELFSGWYPALLNFSSTFTSQLQQSLGSSYKIEDVRNNVGWIASENEFLSRVFQLGMQLWLGRGPWAGVDGSVSSVIQTFAGAISIELKDQKISTPIVDKLFQDLPRMESPVSVGPSRYWTNREHNFAIAQLPDRLMVSSRQTKQIQFHDLEVLSGRGLRILDEPYWKDFSGNVSGRPLFFMHEKVDGPYSILKGLLLVFDSGTRPTAEALGNYRDCYVAATVQPTGIHVYSGVYSAADLPATSSVVSGQDYTPLLQALRRAFQTPIPTPRRKR